MPGRPRLTVIGSLNMDISVSVSRLPGPGETVLGAWAVIGPGGKGANQAVAAARLGGAVRMAGCVGRRTSSAARSRPRSPPRASTWRRYGPSPAAPPGSP